jgi:hypothetical protein
MTGISTDTADVIEFAGLPQFLTGWIASDPARLQSSLPAYAGHPAYGTAHLHQDLHRVTFPPGGNDSEPPSEPGQD